MQVLAVRMTTRRIMIAVAIIAVDLGLMRAAEDSYPPVCVFADALVPSLTLLALAGATAGLGLLKRRQAPPFATGYLLFGGLASFAVCFGLATQTFVFYNVAMREPQPVQDPSLLSVWSGYILDMALMALPQMVSGLVGGGLAVRYGVTRVRIERAKGEARGAEESQACADSNANTLAT